MNVPLLEKVMVAIEAHPDQFDMGSWCGTAKCIGGWAVTLDGRYEVLNQSVWDEAQEVLELTEEEANILLYATQWPAPFGPGEDVPPSEQGTWEHAIPVATAVARIRHFIATDGRE